jgi:hypothetical protein
MFGCASAVAVENDIFDYPCLALFKHSAGVKKKFTYIV